MTRIEQYFFHTRTPVYTVLFVVPLFLVYELLALTLHTFHITTLRNGADVMLRNMASVFGLNNFPMIVFGILVILAIIAGYYKKKHQMEIVLSHFLIMFAECIVYALVMGSISLSLTNFFILIPKAFSLSIVTSTDFWVNIMLSFGAGIHEEFFFRFILIGALLEITRTLLKDKTKSLISWSALIALLASSLIFSYSHHIGDFGEALRLEPFLFRFISGLYLSVIYLLRGFGVSAWTHALYDVFLLTGLMD